MSGSSAIKELEDIIATFSRERRVRVLHRVIDAYVPLAHRLQDPLIDVFDHIICCLIDEVETQALAELGMRLAPLARAPRRTVRLLALNPDVEVAGWVLTESEQVTQEDLAEVASAGSEHHLVAICRRRRLEPPVTEVLVRRANLEAMRILAGNAGAEFSQSGYAALIERGANDAATAEKIIQRPDITPDHLRAMIERASEFVRARLVRAAPAQRRAAVERLIARLSEEPAVKADDERYYAHTMTRLKNAHGTVTEREVAALAGDRKAGEATAALSIVCGIPPETIEELMDQERLEPFLMMCKAANFRWPTVRSLLELRVRPGRSVEDFLTNACGDFNRLSPQLSRQAVKFWRMKRAAAG